MKNVNLLILLLAFVGCKQLSDHKENNNPTDIVEEVNPVKEHLANIEAEALKEPYVGIFTEKRYSTDLFKISSTGVSTLPIQKAADSFLNSLSPSQLKRSTFDIDNEEWRKWCNVDNGIYDRQGVNIKELTSTQKTNAFKFTNI